MVSKVFNADFPLTFPCTGLLYQLLRIARRVPGVGDQMRAVSHHVAVGMGNGYPFRHSLHTRWIKGAVKAFWRRDRPVKRMIGQQQSQRHLRVALFCVYDSPGRQLIKVAITAHHKTCDTVLVDMAFYRRRQSRKQFIACFPVTNEKTDAQFKSPLDLFTLYKGIL